MITLPSFSLVINAMPGHVRSTIRHLATVMVLATPSGPDGYHPPMSGGVAKVITGAINSRWSRSVLTHNHRKETRREDPDQGATSPNAGVFPNEGITEPRGRPVMGAHSAPETDLSLCIVKTVQRDRDDATAHQVEGMRQAGDFIRQHRKRLGLSRADLSEMTGVSGSFLIAVENGFLLPDEVELAHLTIIARTLGLPPDDLLEIFPVGSVKNRHSETEHTARMEMTSAQPAKTTAMMIAVVALTIIAVVGWMR